MKTRFSILTGIAALALVFGLAALAACSNPTGGGSGGNWQDPPRQTNVLMGMDDNGNAYILEITQSTGRAAYTGNVGDGFKLIIIVSGQDDKTCSGTVQSVSTGDTEYTLKPKRGSNFKVKRGTDGGITAITSTTGGGTAEITPDAIGSSPVSVPASMLSSTLEVNGEQVYVDNGSGELVPYTGTDFLPFSQIGVLFGSVSGGKLYLSFLDSISERNLQTDLQAAVNATAGTEGDSDYITVTENVNGLVTVNPNTIRFEFGSLIGSSHHGGAYYGLDLVNGTTHDLDGIIYIYVDGQTTVNDSQSFTQTSTWSNIDNPDLDYDTEITTGTGTQSWSSVTLRRGWNKVKMQGTQTVVSDAINGTTRTITATATITYSATTSSTDGYKWVLSGVYDGMDTGPAGPQGSAH
jgi:hypothetical protein